MLHLASRLAPSDLSAQIITSCVFGELHIYFHLSAAVIQTHILIIRLDLESNWVGLIVDRLTLNFDFFFFPPQEKKIQDSKPRERTLLDQYILDWNLVVPHSLYPL